jgi:hypothetical protein
MEEGYGNFCPMPRLKVRGNAALQQHERGALQTRALLVQHNRWDNECCSSINTPSHLVLLRDRRLVTLPQLEWLRVCDNTKHPVPSDSWEIPMWDLHQDCTGGSPATQELKAAN